MKRLLAVLLAVALALGFALPVLAEETTSHEPDPTEPVGIEDGAPSFFQRVRGVLGSIGSFLGSIFIDTLVYPDVGRIFWRVYPWPHLAVSVCPDCLSVQLDSRPVLSGEWRVRCGNSSR